MRVQLSAPVEAEWLQLRTGAALTPACRVLSAIDAQGRTRGQVVFDLWTLASAQAHIAIDCAAALRPLLRAAAVYIFGVAGRRIVLGIIPAFNDKSQRLAEGLGFKLVHSIRDGWSIGVDLLVMELRRENCRWLKEAA